MARTNAYRARILREAAEVAAEHNLLTLPAMHTLDEFCGYMISFSGDDSPHARSIACLFAACVLEDGR